VSDSKEFKVGDIIRHREVPLGVFHVEVLETKPCDVPAVDPDYPCDETMLRITDPDTGQNDWVHASEFVAVD